MKPLSNGKISQDDIPRSKLPNIEEPLCCCEYMDYRNQRTHLLAVACCCECEAVDEYVDRCLTCRPIPPELYDRINLLISDRIRLPWCSGGGAFRLRSDVIMPLICIPLLIWIGTWHPVLTAFMFCTTPFFIFLIYRILVERKDRSQSRFFFNWSLLSMTLCYFVLMVLVNIYRKLLLWENMTFNSLFLLLLYCLILVHQEPGRVKPRAAGTGRSKVHMKSRSYTSGEIYAEIGTSNSNYYKSAIMHNHQQQSNRNAPDSSDKSRLVTSSNHSGPNAYSEVENGPTYHRHDPSLPTDIFTWCGTCNVEQPPRSSHCYTCNMCINARDHHCPWLGTCIGGSNHRIFFVGCIIFLLTNLYGILLALTTVCTPNMYFDWFLFPVNCDFVYEDGMTSWIFVTCVYSMLSIPFVFLVFVYHCVLISQNLTSKELHRAQIDRRTRFYLWVPNHPYNRGFWRNWIDFLANRRVLQPVNTTYTVQPACRYQHEAFTEQKSSAVVDKRLSNGELPNSLQHSLSNANQFST